MALDPADRDPSVDPGTDFYRFANGGWLDTHPIPPGYGAWGAFEEISIRNEAIVHRVVEEASTAPDAVSACLAAQCFRGVPLTHASTGGSDTP